MNLSRVSGVPLRGLSSIPLGSLWVVAGPKFLICTVEMSSRPITFPGFKEAIPFSDSSICVTRIFAVLYAIKFGLILHLSTFAILQQLVSDLVCSNLWLFRWSFWVTTELTEIDHAFFAILWYISRLYQGMPGLASSITFLPTSAVFLGESRYSSTRLLDKFYKLVIIAWYWRNKLDLLLQLLREPFSVWILNT